MTDKNKNQKYLDPLEIKELMRQFWEKENKILNIMFGSIEVSAHTLKSSTKGNKI